MSKMEKESELNLRLILASLFPDDEVVWSEYVHKTMTWKMVDVYLNFELMTMFA